MSGEYCCANCLSRDAVAQCGDACGAAFYCGQECANAHYATHQLACIEARHRRRREEAGLPPDAGGGGYSEAKVHRVMREFREGALHLGGSKTGPVVRSRKQAVVIALAERDARNNE